MKSLPPAFRSIPSGPELVEAIAEVFGQHQGWVQAVGFVEDVELKVGSEGADVRRAFRGRFALAQLGGPLGGPYGATLARSEGERLETLAGVLLRARSAGVSALCVSAGGMPVAPSAEVAPSIEPTPSPAPAARPPLQRPAGASFAARVGAARPDDDDDSESPVELPQRGDLVEHFAFGLCEVLNVAGDRLILRDIQGPGRIREVASDRLAVSGPSEHAGKRLFLLTKRA